MNSLVFSINVSMELFIDDVIFTDIARVANFFCTKRSWRLFLPNCFNKKENVSKDLQY